MLSRLGFILSILYIFSCTDIVYGNDVKNIKDLLDDDISLLDKLEYLTFIKDSENYSISSEDINILNYVFLENQYEKAISKHNEVNRLISEIKSGIDKESKEINPKEEDKKIMDQIRATILEIFLKEDVNDNILTPEQITAIANQTIIDLYSSFYLPSNIRYLDLKVLIKINELKLNADDERSAFMREVKKYALSDRPDIIQQIEEQESSHEKEGFWDCRGVVEGCIFSPVLLIDYGFYNVNQDDKNNYYKVEDKRVLEEYEKYLLDHIKFFPITDSLKVFVEASFFKTQFKHFRSKYIDAMYALDMKETLLKIILNRSIDIELRKQAIDVGIKLLDEVDILYFKRFSMYLFRSLKVVTSDTEEDKEFKTLAKEKMKYVKSVISTHDDMKDLEYVLFNPDISVDEKIECLDAIVKLDLYFSPQKASFFIRRVLLHKDLDIKVKARAASIIVCRTDIRYVSYALKSADLEALAFLYITEKRDKGPELESMPFIMKLKLNDFIRSTINDRVIIEQSGRFDMWKQLIKFIDGTISVDDSIKKLAIRTCLNLLPRTKDFEEFSSLFLKTLQNISDNMQESMELRNIVDYILVKIKNEGISLKEIKHDCSLKMML